MTTPEQPEPRENSAQTPAQPDLQAGVPLPEPVPPAPVPPAPVPPELTPAAPAQAARPESFAANVERLVTEGKLTAAEAAELLEPAHEPVAAAVPPPVFLGKPESLGKPEGSRSDDLRLEVAGYSLQVVYDPSLDEPRLSANRDGVLSLRAGPGGWSIETLEHHRLGGLKAVLGLPFTPRNVRAEVSGGNLSLPDMSGDVVVEVSGGNATLGGAGRLQAEVSGGNLTAGEVAGELRLEVNGGNMTVAGSAALRAEVNGGHLSWAGLLQSGTHSVAVNGGQATLRLGAASSVEVQAESTLGGVSASFPLQKSGGMMHATYHGLLGSGAARLKCEVNAGQIRLTTDSGAGS